MDEPQTGISRRGMVAGAAALGVALPLVAEAAADASAPGIIATAKVPVGGGVIIAAHRVVVTQPKRGRFEVFSAICTHQGCLVSQVANRTIDCLCHGSEFSITNGHVVGGPAPRPLARRAFKVKSGHIVLT